MYSAKAGTITPGATGAASMVYNLVAPGRKRPRVSRVPAFCGCALALSLTAGCAVDGVEPTTLAKLMPLVALQGWFSDGGAELHLVPHQAQDVMHCPQLGPELAGNIDGRPLQVVDAGSTDTGYDAAFMPQGFCKEPVLRRGAAAAPERAVSTIELSDTSGTFTIKVSELFAPRKVELVSPADGRVRAGDQVTVGWSTSSDEVTPDHFTLYPPNRRPDTFPLYGIAGKSPRGNEGVLTQEGRNQWSFTMPEKVKTGPLPTGPITLTCNVSPKPKVLSCAQFASCDLLLSTGSMTDISLEVM